MIAMGHNVVFAGNEQQRIYIEQTFPGIESLQLDGYNVTYSKHEYMFMPALLKQVPALLSTIKKEHNWLAQVVQQHNIDAVVSDNRYGLWHRNVPCVIMTHQLQVLTGKGRIADNLLRKMHYKYLERFDDCWVVDVPGAQGLSGVMAHPGTIPANAAYLGLLSQAERTADEKKDSVLVLLSGPEPQRSVLSAKIWEQVLQMERPVIFIEGSNNADSPTNIPEHITYHKLLAKQDLKDAISRAGIVVCRSGYSTIMDLVKLGKKAILVPTPGQTEQEYLAKQLHEQNIFLAATQKELDIDTLLKEAKSFPFQTMELQSGFELHKKVVDKWLQKIKES